MIPQFQDLKYFLVIAETGNLSRASERLGVGQPTLSQAVKRLEDASSVPLLIRQKRGVELTRAGEMLKTRAAELISSWQFIMNEVKGSETLPQGHLIIGAHPSVAQYSFGKFLPRFLKDNDLISISLVHGLSREVLEGVVSGKVDFGLVINPRPHPDLVLRKLAEDKVGFYQGKTETPDVLICDPSMLQSQSLMKKTKGKIEFRRQISTSNLEVAANLVASGCGIGLLPERVAARFDLKLVSSKLPVFSDELYLCYRQDRQKSVASKVFIQAVLKAQI